MLDNDLTKTHYTCINAFHIVGRRNRIRFLCEPIDAAPPLYFWGAVTLPVPLSWLYLLPAEARNTAGALHILAQLPAAERQPSSQFTVDTPIQAINALREIALRQPGLRPSKRYFELPSIRGKIKPGPAH